MERHKTIIRNARPVSFGVLFALLVVAASQPAWPEVLVWDFDYPFAAGNTVAMDLGATMTGITQVVVEAEGVGGERRFICYLVEPLESSLPFYGYLAFDQDVGSGTSAGSFFMGQLPGPSTPFNGNGLAEAASGWSFLEDGSFTLTVRYELAEPLPWDYPICIQLGATWPVVAHLTLRIACENAVPNELTTWSTVKSLYR